MYSEINTLLFDLYFLIAATEDDVESDVESSVSDYPRSTTSSVPSYNVSNKPATVSKRAKRAAMDEQLSSFMENIASSRKNTLEVGIFNS